MMLLDQANSRKQENHRQILSLDLIIQHHSSHLLILLSTLTMAQLNILTHNEEFQRIKNNNSQEKNQARVLQQLGISIKLRVVESNLCHI
uniref:Ovule protein n=1 Tax=Meloidogyne incognita TaxID=6306 RepID=A0A914L4J2_MELIC